MNREEIRAHIPGITQEQEEWLMAEHGKAVQTSQQTIATLTAERDTARSQLQAANTQLEGYDPEWKSKAETARQQAEARVAELEAGYAAERAISELQFSSESAKKAFLADLKAKKLPLQDGKLLGFEDFAKTYKDTDPNAFIPEGGTPRVTATSTGTPAGQTGKDAANAAFRAIFGKE